MTSKSTARPKKPAHPKKAAHPKKTADPKKTGRQRNHGPVTSMSGLLDHLEECCVKSGERVTVAELMRAVGRRSFGPLILLLGLIGLAPISNIPGVVAVVAALDLLVIAEMLIGMDHVWIPGFLARRSMTSAGLKRALTAIRKPAKFVDNFLEPRLTWLTRGLAFYALAAVCLLVAIALPFIELIPFAGIVPNAALVAFGLALTAHDGMWALIGLAIVTVSVYLLWMAVSGMGMA